MNTDSTNTQSTSQAITCDNCQDLLKQDFFRALIITSVLGNLAALTTYLVLLVA